MRQLHRGGTPHRNNVFVFESTYMLLGVNSTRRDRCIRKVLCICLYLFSCKYKYIPNSQETRRSRLNAIIFIILIQLKPNHGESNIGIYVFVRLLREKFVPSYVIFVSMVSLLSIKCLTSSCLKLGVVAISRISSISV